MPVIQKPVDAKSLFGEGATIVFGAKPPPWMKKDAKSTERNKAGDGPVRDPGRAEE
jgi:hypothetical protein